MRRAITGYHQDLEQHWVAELSCGHGQHVRHKPPMTSRPWVLNEAGRSSMLGTELDCIRCDRLELPEGFVAYKRTTEFDQDSVPKGLTRDHSTRAGVWGVIHVLDGRLRYVIDGMGGREFLLDAATPGIVVSEVRHHVLPEGTVRFFVEFHHRPPSP